MTASSIAIIVAWGIGGLLLGWLHVRLLRSSVEQLVPAGRLHLYLGRAVLRVTAMASIFLLASLCGMPSLLAAAGGFLVGQRWLIARAASSRRPQP